MSTIIIDGKALAQNIRHDVANRVSALKEKGITACLAVIILGDDPASQSYVRGKEKACGDVGILSRDYKLSSTTSEEELVLLIEELNRDESVHGILVQLPLPKHINESTIIETIDPNKDVDGFHPNSLGKLMLGQDTFIPCTPHGVIKMLESVDISTEGKNIVIIGRSHIVGSPLSQLLIQKTPTGNATVTICHSRTKNLSDFTKRADIIIAAVGVPQMLTSDMVSDGVVIIDVGVNRVEDSTKAKGYRLVGDVDFEGMLNKASVLTPVPGGVGPMTITMLLFNTIKSAEITFDRR
ncbi:bifunctional methylenetetrahydrofolate dehydrogenase/methenyltetrahydrofolate cyclohydrolase FolD [Spirochaeta cellobiosiphila]|uniref:bifunctional methylenetetrahydrofolate dehydrogenase/methenyltetrahydrofolate cyclohydrolase FolD n=1 Tax=Spirochaeta cellobiosiphila TaxID=504483 RepID=UPI0004180520|nr:bifunctional methylenetetrahydrofolate dehydrogenase/methenyltetrahydrofolate cyclohydrolase FolD [Spirochaeta cellobiosiphila]